MQWSCNLFVHFDNYVLCMIWFDLISAIFNIYTNIILICRWLLLIYFQRKQLTVIEYTLALNHLFLTKSWVETFDNLKSLFFQPLAYAGCFKGSVLYNWMQGVIQGDSGTSLFLFIKSWVNFPDTGSGYLPHTWPTSLTI